MRSLRTTCALVTPRFTFLRKVSAEAIRGCYAATAVPHPGQNLLLAAIDPPHCVQYRAAPDGFGGFVAAALAPATRMAVQAHTKAMIQPRTVQPSRRFNANTAVELWCLRPAATNVGKK
jgi:hypothetical protein